MHQPGKYDYICAWVRKDCKARGVILLIIGGRLGHGMSCQLPPDEIKNIPAKLRVLADSIEKEQADELKTQGN